MRLGVAMGWVGVKLLQTMLGNRRGAEGRSPEVLRARNGEKLGLRAILRESRTGKSVDVAFALGHAALKVSVGPFHSRRGTVPLHFSYGNATG